MRGRPSFLPKYIVNNPLYPIWLGIKNRCYNSNNMAYKYYGGRGITMCDKWLNSFEAFCEDIGERPSKLYSVDRIDNNGNYEPGNCRWATMKEQAQNKRRGGKPRLNPAPFIAIYTMQLNKKKGDAIKCPICEVVFIKANHNHKFCTLKHRKKYNNSLNQDRNKKTKIKSI